MILGTPDLTQPIRRNFDFLGWELHSGMVPEYRWVLKWGDSILFRIKGARVMQWGMGVYIAAKICHLR